MNCSTFVNTWLSTTTILRHGFQWSQPCQLNCGLRIRASGRGVKTDLHNNHNSYYGHQWLQPTAEKPLRVRVCNWAEHKFQRYCKRSECGNINGLFAQVQTTTKLCYCTLARSRFVVATSTRPSNMKRISHVEHVYMPFHAAGPCGKICVKTTSHIPKIFFFTILLNETSIT